MFEVNGKGGEPFDIFTKEDIVDLLMEEGYDESSCFMEAQGYQMIVEVAHNFVEEILDTFKHKKKEISVTDVKEAASLKFPEIYIGDELKNKMALQNKANTLDENDDRVREAEKKLRAKEVGATEAES
jgi:hypothetical protein